MEQGNKNLNLVGQVFGKLTVIELTDQRKDGSKVWKCVCSCGNEHYANTKHLRRGCVKSCKCGWYDRNKSKGRPYVGEDIVGKRYGLLVVLRYLRLNKHHNKIWECQCDCGNIHNVTTNCLNRGHTTSCGCMGYRSGNRRKEQIHNYSGYQDITGSKWNSIVNNAKIRGLEFNITKEQVWDIYEQQNKNCYFSGVPISFQDRTASIDRLDSTDGYNIENIVLVHKDINRMKSNFTIKSFIKMCKNVVNNIPNIDILINDKR